MIPSIFDFIRDGLLVLPNSSEEPPNEPLFTNIEDIQPEDIPFFIGKSFEMIESLEKQNNKAIKAVKKAEKGADSAKEKSAGFGKKKVAIEALQDAGVDAAEALIDVVEAKKLSFGLHGQMAGITKHLFALGTVSLAINRSVVRELEAKLTGASVEKLSDLAKAEVISVVRQLKAQEDMMSKQKNMGASLKKHNGVITKLAETNKQFENQLEIYAKTIKHLDKELRGLLKQIERQNQSFSVLRCIVAKKSLLLMLLEVLAY